MNDGNEAAGFACPECHETRSVVIGWIREANPRGYFKGMVLKCMACEHTYTVRA